MKHGKYRNKDNEHEWLHLDIPGPGAAVPLSCVSLFALRNGVLENHWLADIEINPASNKWHGEVVFPEQSEFRNVTIWQKVENEINVFVQRQNGSARRSTYEFISYHFREVTFKFDYQPGYAPLLEYNPGDHPEAEGYKPNVPRQTISIESVFEQAGVKVTRFAAPTQIVPNGINGDTWTDRELNYLMQMSWPESQRPMPPEWSLWVFFASRYESNDLEGRMFDFEDDKQRQGCVTFYNSGVHVLDAPEYTKRKKFWTTCHEIGHAFNLGHTDGRQEHTIWRPFFNDSRELSFMTFPEVYAGDEYYFHEFGYQFSPKELQFIRHAPAHLVRMGSAPWFDDTDEDQVDSNREAFFEENQEDIVEVEPLPLKLALKLDKEDFEYFEPVMMEVHLVNNTSEEMQVDKHALTNNNKLMVWIRRNKKEVFLHRNYVYDCYKTSMITLQPKGAENDEDRLKAPFFASVGKKGWIITDPGDYEIKAIYLQDKGHMKSNTVQLTVQEGPDAMKEIADLYFSDEVGRTMAFDGAIEGSKGNNVLEAVVKDFPESMAAVHSKVALAMPYTTNFRKMVLPDVKENIQEAQPEKAREMLEFALKGANAEQKALSLGLLDYEFYTIEYEKLLK